MTTTVIGYSSAHFDPNIVETLYPNSSAAFLASAIYRAAVKASERVIYVDASRPDTWPKVSRVDFLIAIESGFSKLIDHFRPNLKLLFAVNQEYVCTLNKLLDPIISGSLPVSSLFRSQDLLNRDKKAELLADKILIVGDNVTFGTYLTIRDIKDLHVVPYSYEPSYLSQKRDHRLVNILIPASTIGVRKGSDFIPEICQRIKQYELDNVRIIAYGSASNRYWEGQIRRWSQNHSSYFQYLGWVDPSSELSREIHAVASCSVFPSREEGLVGTGMESMLANIPTFASQECGLGFRDPDFVLRAGDAFNWADQVLQYCVKQTLVAPLKEPRESIRLSCSTAVESAVERFILASEIQPMLWIRRLNDRLQLSTNASENSLPISESLRFLPKDELNAVLGAMGLLESNFTDKMITLMAISPSQVAADGNIDSSRLIHLTCGTVENTGVLNFLIEDSHPEEMLAYFYVESDPVRTESLIDKQTLRANRIKVILWISIVALLVRRTIGRVLRSLKARFRSCFIRKRSSQ